MGTAGVTGTDVAEIRGTDSSQVAGSEVDCGRLRSGLPDCANFALNG